MIMVRSLIALLASTALVAGCNFAPDHVRPQGAIPDTLPQGVAYPPAPTDAPDVTAIGWRDFFTDPKLQGVIALGLENNRDLRLAAANVLQARAQYRVQRASLLPTIAGTASYTVTNNAAGAGAGGGGSRPGAPSSETSEFYSLNLGISSFEIDLFGRLRNLTRAAQEQYFASEATQRATRISLIGEIASAWLTLAADQEQLAIARETYQSFGQTLELTRAQFKLGVVSELDVQQADTNYQAARNDIAALTTQVAQDQNALNLLAGTTVAADLLPGQLGEADYTRPDLPADLSSRVLLQRPDVLSAEHQLIAQEANIGAARAAFFPSISLTTAIGTISGGLSDLFGAGTKSWSVAPSATLPIFDFGARTGNLRYAQASREAAVATYEKTLQTAFQEVADALATRGTISEQVAARTARSTAATQAARLSDARYKAGVDGFLTLLEAQRTAYGARQDLVTTRLARVQNLVQLYRVLGGGLN